MRLIDRSILVGLNAFHEASALKAQAYAIAPWLADAAPVEQIRDGGHP